MNYYHCHVNKYRGSDIVKEKHATKSKGRNLYSPECEYFTHDSIPLCSIGNNKSVWFMN